MLTKKNKLNNNDMSFVNLFVFRPVTRARADNCGDEINALQRNFNVPCVFPWLDCPAFAHAI